jgi:hypothetical protein
MGRRSSSNPRASASKARAAPRPCTSSGRDPDQVPAVPGAPRNRIHPALFGPAEQMGARPCDLSRRTAVVMAAGSCIARSLAVDGKGRHAHGTRRSRRRVARRDQMTGHRDDAPVAGPQGTCTGRWVTTREKFRRPQLGPRQPGAEAEERTDPACRCEDMGSISTPRTSMARRGHIQSGSARTRAGSAHRFATDRR